MKRSISISGLLFASISAIIGSGWLFSAFYASTLAGPASLLSWLIGGFFILIIAFVFAEICSMLPVTGSSARIPQYTHGTLVSYLFAWMTWLACVAFTAAEVQAVVQYADFYIPALTNGTTGQLTVHGYFAATVLMMIVSFINVYSIRWLIRCNSSLTVLKLAIPSIIVVTILLSRFSVAQTIHAGGSDFMPMGMEGVLTAIASGGIVFAFNGFKQAAEMAGEAKNPGVSIPLAIVGSVSICMVLFLLIQIAFLNSVEASNLTNGWGHLALLHNSIPLASIIASDHASMLLPILYVAAVIAPFAAGLMYCSGAARSLYGMSKSGYLPTLFQKLTPQGNPYLAISVNFGLGMCLFAPLPGWQTMMNFLTSMLAISYAAGPLCMAALRRQVPKQYRPIRLPFGYAWSFIAFYMCTLLAYWNGWSILSIAGFAILAGFVILFVYRRFSKKLHIRLNMRESIWVWPYFVGLLLISYLGNFGGGAGVLSFKICMVLLLFLCAFVFYLAVKFCLPSQETQHYIHALHLDHTKARA